ncbi:hypothetical protein BUALT_Bualt07G0123100 [Buddleja alternifolia]|uniref:Uncharacterized protein n=1 Tax=Buddleja alternifolia TaxID=168488 RepID=A0AAV6XAA8_9LAMI|nr:hypothetical protein BUALT_Bualt07G0123100 [Buddleja alternifolia]
MSFQPNMLATLTSNFNQKQWVEQIRQALDDKLEEETLISVTIFSVPKTLMIINPDCYIPQLLAIGPYHHLRGELYDMEKYKLAAAKRNQRELENMKLQDIVDHLMKCELRIRANYHRPLGYNGEALAWMMAVDSSFLFEFLQVCGVKEGKIVTKIPSRVEHLIDLSKTNKPAHNAILRDIILLENQIPLFVMRMLLEFQFSSLNLADETLISLLIGVSKELSPFKVVKGSRKIDIKECAHFLDFLYKFIVPKLDVPSEIIEIQENKDEIREDNNKVMINSFSTPSYLRHFFDELWKILSKLGEGSMQKIKKIIISLKPFKVIAKLPWTILMKIPVIKVLKEPIENIFSGMHKDNDEEKKDDDKEEEDKPPLMEEITIPSVTELVEVGVQFLPTTNEGITSIDFDKESHTFRIPIVNLDVNSEVVLRNLVAYEACSSSGPLVLTRYTELMNGIIDTENDIKLLCERGIIINHLKNEKEVMGLWNGMSRSIRLTKVPSLDKVIGDANKFYNGKWKVKFGKFMKRYVFGSWRILTFLAAIMLLIVTTLQAFCQVYSCARILPIKGLEPVKV